MSRVGNKLIPIPEGVTLSQDGRVVRAKGKLGELTTRLQPGIDVKIDGNVATVETVQKDRKAAAIHGTSRAMVANIVEGVSNGFKRELEIIGTGYRVSLEGSKLVFKLNYDHPIDFPLPEGIKAEVTDRPPRVTISGIDKELVGQVAANIRGLQPPEPYKGKGVKFVTEQIRRKAGKSSG
ncbi:MAG: 50S ribosomal protein L6 [Candidatus Eisenbacteria bacterium]|nr:50S ribosomal protein L6 [Candidatus Latescibacterota bacterium]MBD3301968.1 50S ribosomal protein L6 [Candidatus Eisenbacteria bacterium]